jgi:hypothetical protein
MVAGGKAERWVARTKLESYEDSFTRWENYQQEAEWRRKAAALTMC